MLLNKFDPVTSNCDRIRLEISVAILIKLLLSFSSENPLCSFACDINTFTFMKIEVGRE